MTPAVPAPYSPVSLFCGAACRDAAGSRAPVKTTASTIDHMLVVQARCSCGIPLSAVPYDALVLGHWSAPIPPAPAAKGGAR